MVTPTPAPATAESGIFTRLEPLPNTYTSDAGLQRMLGCESVQYSSFLTRSHVNITGYLPADILQKAEPNLAQLGEEAVSPQLNAWNADAEINQPYVKKYNVWGQRYGYDRLVTTEGWKQIGKWGAKHGYVVSSVSRYAHSDLGNLGSLRWDTTARTAPRDALFSMLRE